MKPSQSAIISTTTILALALTSKFLNIDFEIFALVYLIYQTTYILMRNIDKL